MFKFSLLVFSAAAVGASPALRSASSGSHGSLAYRGGSRGHRRRGDLPPVSVVFAELQSQSILPIPTGLVSATPTGNPTFTPTASLPMTTPPHTGPGIVVLSDSSASTALPTRTPVHGKEGDSMSPIARHFAIVGGAIACVLLLTACCFIFSNPRTWKCCRRLRRNKPESAKAEDECEPGWTQIDLEPPKSPVEKEKLSPSPIFLEKSKFSTGSDYYGEPDALSSYDPSVLSPLPRLSYDAPARPSTPCPPSPTGTALPGTPIRPPRPPTEDSPAGIESMYYADVDDKGFYRHPNPMVLEPTSPAVNKSPATDGDSGPQFLPHIHQLFSSNPLGIDGLQRHVRCQSAPTLDRPLTINRESDIASIAGTMGSVGSESVYSTMKPQRKSTSAVSWIRYSEFQQQHHLRLQRQSAPSPSTSRGDIGAAY